VNVLTGDAVGLPGSGWTSWLRRWVRSTA